MNAPRLTLNDAHAMPQGGGQSFAALAIKQAAARAGRTAHIIQTIDLSLNDAEMAHIAASGRGDCRGPDPISFEKDKH